MVRHDIVREIERDIFSDDLSIYNGVLRDSLLEDDELTPEEAAFMQGYDEAG